MESKKEVKLGHRVHDIVSGYEGIAYQETLLMSGTVQFSVQPDMSDKMKESGEYPAGMSIDVHTLEYIGDGIADRVIAPPQVGIKIGEKVEDEVTGLVGVATSRVTFANGCVYFNVQPPIDKDGKVPEPHFLDHKRLKTIGKGLSERISQEKPDEPKRTPGGPATRAQRAS